MREHRPVSFFFFPLRFPCFSPYPAFNSSRTVDLGRYRDNWLSASKQLRSQALSYCDVDGEEQE